MIYLNENDWRKAEWCRQLMKDGYIPQGKVDDGSIEHLIPDDLRRYKQCHFFAGIGGWPYALRLAGWPDDREVWTGSCPCQPFSEAGEGGGFLDQRHLWPSWFHLVDQFRPDTIFGEQVASDDGLTWLDLVSADLEAADYAVGVAILPAAGFGSPQRRYRIFFVAHRQGDGRRQGDPDRAGGGERAVPKGQVGGSSDDRSTRGVADAGRKPPRVDRSAVGDGSDVRAPGGKAKAAGKPRRRGKAGVVGDADQPGLEGHGGHVDNRRGSGRKGASSARPAPATGLAGILERAGRPGPANGFWGDADWLRCRDELWRPARPGSFVLADGIPERVLRIRGYGDAISPWVAAGFIKAFMESTA